ncbi:Maltooligosyl trehalose synthase [Jannaschia seosinensis]|uniref:Maltooligosyl trehalose synthase n=1 Tax=Jannaschia seosinensis TaxID=313367 RepID=A0A0M7BCU0_9RHOB|nr:malto-oligosyltrehalose synthase [Jannaschia seosinensis]CUH40009.1 Maltooligosyl trehalose synthase [Jannaschia seosinensis]
MKLPTATYRLQLREGMDFARAADLVPYWRDLGVSHLYLAPVFTAAPGSTHGYDVTDPNEVEPDLGGRAGLEALADRLHEAGLGLILDIVPNHMAFTVHNPWLSDVLRHGRDSRFADHFDINWSNGRLRLPWLGAPFAELAAAGDIEVEGDEMVAPGLRIPLATQPEGDLTAIHNAQPWRLTHWRTESAAIDHRRFFTVTGLIGLRIEDPNVFEDVHRLTFDLIESGVADGLRVDHVDGLADPDEYLGRLRDRLPGTPIWVEKILTGDEPLPDWPVEGTTGYVAARSIARVLTDGDGAARMAEGWPAFHDVRDDAKTQIVTTELQAEVERLTNLAVRAGAHLEWGRASWRQAILAYVRAFPRYRTYATADAVPEADAELIRDTAARAARDRPAAAALGDLTDLLTDRANSELRLRLQQLTGAAIAKAQEDTAFYRWTPLLSANEVGAEPDEPAMDADAFHTWMERRAALMPNALTLTSSHDTKRSEDARMRIAAISHDPDAAEALLSRVPDLPQPWRWYLAQSAFAAAPDGDLAERLPAHLEKAMREAKRDTFWTDVVEEFEGPVLDAARSVADRFAPADDLSGLATRAENLALAQCALKFFVPGIPDIYQGTEIGSFRLTDPDNRAAVDWDALAKLNEGAEVRSPFDRTKFDLTRTLLQLRRDNPDAFTTEWRALDAPEGELRAARGPFVLHISTRGTTLPAGGDALWPASGPSPVRVMRAT